MRVHRTAYVPSRGGGSAAAPEGPSRSLVDSGRALLERGRRAPEILRTDGLSVLAGKAAHAIRRGRRGDAGYVSFVGEVVDGPAPAGARVAGFSLTHPAAVELVLARPEHVVEAPDGVADTAAALAIYGAMAVYAADRALLDADGRVGVAGSGPLAELARAALTGAGGEVSPDARVWIDAGGGPASASAASIVIGLGRPAGALDAEWPSASERVALDVEEVLRDPDRIVDLFYDDAEPDLPAWLGGAWLSRYLELAARTGLSLADEPPLVALGDAPSPAGTAAPGGPVLVDFGRSPRPLAQRLDSKRGPSSERIGVSVVGAGEFPLGMILRQLEREPDVELRGACDRRPEMLDLAGQALPFAYLTTDYGDVLEDSGTDVVVVATYHGSHAGLGAAALRAGKHCFVEKPPVVDQAQLDELFGAAAASDRMLHIGYNRRFAPATDVLMRNLGRAEGPATIDVVVHGVPLPPNSWYFWPSNGNRIISNTCHFIDLALQVCGEAAPVRVTAMPSEVGRRDKNVNLSIAWSDGSIASITYTDRGSDRSTSYFQSYHFMKGDTTALLEDFHKLTVYREGRKVDGWRGALDIGHGPQMRAFAAAVRAGGPPPVPLRAQELSARVVLAAAEAAETGTPVELSPAAVVSG